MKIVPNKDQHTAMFLYRINLHFWTNWNEWLNDLLMCHWPPCHLLAFCVILIVFFYIYNLNNSIFQYSKSFPMNVHLLLLFMQCLFKIFIYKTHFWKVYQCLSRLTQKLCIIIIKLRWALFVTYTEYNQQWNVFSAFNPSKCTHTWSSGQPTQRRPWSSWGFGALLNGLTLVVDNSCRSRDSNPQARVTSLTLCPLEPRLPLFIFLWLLISVLLMLHQNWRVMNL